MWPYLCVHQNWKLKTRSRLFHVSDAILSHLPVKWPASGAANWSNGRHISKEHDEQVLGKFSPSLGGPDRLSGCRRALLFPQPPWRGTRENAFAESSLRSLYRRDVWRKQRRAYTFEWPRDYPANGLQIQFGRVGCARPRCQPQVTPRHPAQFDFCNVGRRRRLDMGNTHTWITAFWFFRSPAEGGFAVLLLTGVATWN